MLREGKKATQGIYYYNNPEIEKWRYNPYRKANRIKAEHYYKDLKKATDFPLHLIIEPTNYCNLKCFMCNREVMNRELAQMDLDMFKKIVDEAVEHHIYSISIYALGEPLMNKHIREMVSYAKRRGIPYVDVSTNAMFDMRPLLGTSLNELIVSIDGDEKTYDEVRIGGNYHKVVNNLKEFIKSKQEGNYDWPLIRLQIIDFDPPKYDIDKLIEEWLSSNQIDVVYKKKLEGMTQSIGNTAISKEEQCKRNTGRMPCKQLYYTLTVNSNGDIAYCCHDPQGQSVLGNIKDITLADAWKKEEKIREGQRNGVYGEFCQNCCDWENW